MKHKLLVRDIYQLNLEIPLSYVILSVKKQTNFHRCDVCKDVYKQ